MKLQTEKFTLRSVSPLAGLEYPKDYNQSMFIKLDLGKKQRNDECVALFEFESDSIVPEALNGSCSCMGGSMLTKTKKGHLITIKYKSSRIGLQDKGVFYKDVQVRLSDSSKIKFNIRIDGSK